MKKFAVVALVLAVFVPVLAAQAPSFTGKWEGTITMPGPDGADMTRPAAFNLTQKGNVLTGTAGPPDQQLDIANGTVDASKATFEVQPPSGAPYKFAVAIVKGRLQGELNFERNGSPVKAKIDAAKAPAK